MRALITAAVAAITLAAAAPAAQAQAGTPPVGGNCYWHDLTGQVDGYVVEKSTGYPYACQALSSPFTLNDDVWFTEPDENGCYAWGPNARESCV